MSADKSKMKKKVRWVYHGKRTLWKDDLMMHNGVTGLARLA